MKALKSKLFVLLITGVFFAQCKPESPAVPATQTNTIAIKLLENDSSNLLLKFKPCFHFVLIAQNTSVNIF